MARLSHTPGSTSFEALLRQAQFWSEQLIELSLLRWLSFKSLRPWNPMCSNTWGGLPEITKCASRQDGPTNIVRGWRNPSSSYVRLFRATAPLSELPYECGLTNRSSHALPRRRYAEWPKIGSSGMRSVMTRSSFTSAVFVRRRHIASRMAPTHARRMSASDSVQCLLNHGAAAM